MANETRSLIAGEAAAPIIVERARAALEADPRVASVVEVASLHLGPTSILMAVTLRFHGGLSGDEVQAAADELVAVTRAADSRIGDVFLRPGGPPG
jgi:divalent metal cation (Fe/Co/Zn/Cd) transporter